MNKNGLVKRVAKEYNMAIGDTKAWVDAIFEVLGQAVIEDDVIIHGFGAFRHKDRAPRVGRNASTGERIDIPAKTAVVFDISEKLSEQLNSKESGET